MSHCRWIQWRYLPLSSPDAVCLDGSRAGISYRSAAGGTNPVVKAANKKRWVIYFEGGGWCFSAADCVLRARSPLGTNTSKPGKPPRVPVDHGNVGAVVDPCCSVSTDFCDYNKVFFHYCDGASFVGGSVRSLSLPAEPGASAYPRQVYSAGRAIVAAGLQVLIDEHKLGEATDVLLTGFSAGGLAALLNAETVRSALRGAGAPLRRFKVASFSGVFMPSAIGSRHAHAQAAATASSSSSSSYGSSYSSSGNSGSADEVALEKHAFAAQLRDGLRGAGMVATPSCAAWLRRGGHDPARDAWRCALDTAPLEALPEDMPAFVAQSSLDWWQIGCTLGAGASIYAEANCSHGRWQRCSPRSKFEHLGQGHCTTAQLAAVRRFALRSTSMLLGSAGLQRPGGGAFLHSCYEHSDNRDTFVAHSIGGVTLMKSLREWWRADAKAPAEQHTRLASLPQTVDTNVSACDKSCRDLHSRARPSRCSRFTAAPNPKTVSHKRAAIAELEQLLGREKDGRRLTFQ